MNQIQELALRDETGTVKQLLLSDALKNLNLNQLTRSLLPPYFYNEIYKKNNTALAETKVARAMAFSEGDLVDIFPKYSKPVQKAFYDFVAKVSAHPDTVYQYYMNTRRIEIDLEVKDNEGPLEMIDRLLNYCFGLTENSIVSSENIGRLQRVQRFFQGEELKSICVDFNETAEYTRQLVKQNNLFIHILKGQSNFVLPQSFADILEKFKVLNMYRSNFFEGINIDSEEGSGIKSAANKLEFVGINVCGIKSDSQRFYITDKDVTYFGSYVNSFQQFFKKIQLFIDYDQVVEQFKEYYKKEKKFKEEYADDTLMLQTVLHNADYVDMIVDDNGSKRYRSTWANLSSMSLKVARILYENNRMMSLQEIFDSYNQKLTEAGEDQLTDISQLYVKSEDGSQSPQNGYWIYSSDTLVRADVRKIISDFLVSRNGMARLNEIHKYVTALGYKYSSRTVRTYVLNSAVVSADDRDVFVHNDFAGKVSIQLQNRRLQTIGKDLLPIIVEILLSLDENISKRDFFRRITNSCKENNLQINSRNVIYGYVEKLYKQGYYNIDGNEIIADSIDSEGLQALEYRPEPSYRHHLRNEAVVMLKEAQGHMLRANDIYTSLRHLIPKNVSTTVFYKIFSNSNFFVKDEIDGKLAYRLNLNELPLAKPLNVQVFEPEERIVESNEDFLPVDVIVQEHLQVNESEGSQISGFNLNFQLNNEQVFAFIESELRRKYKNAEWFNSGFEDFKVVVGSKVQEDQFWGTKILKALGRVLINISDFFDRDSCLQRLSLSFETYLKQFDELKGGHDRRVSLGEMIHQSSKMSLLLNYSKAEKFRNAYHKDDVVYGFSKSLSKIWHYRNTYAHDQESEALEITISDHIRYIMDFIGLYIFIPYYLKEVV